MTYQIWGIEFFLVATVNFKNSARVAESPIQFPYLWENRRSSPIILDLAIISGRRAVLVQASCL
jgi:hypothetical protein